jgi:diguanylate cyclase (GGDEF)-like protein
MGVVDSEIKYSLLLMSVYVFYAEVNVACICFLMLLLFSIKSLPTPQMRFTLFQKLVFWHILYFLNDSVWALVNDGIFVKNTISVLAVNYLNAIIAAVLFYSCFIYAEMSSRPDMTKPQIQKLQSILRIPIVVEAVVLFVFFVLDPEFWLDENLEPRDLYYFVLVFLPCVYMVTVTIRGLIRGFARRNRHDLTTYLIVASYTPGAILAAGTQIFFSMTTPIFCFWCTFVILFVYLHSQNQLVSTDPLTMLNNRNRLEKYLYQQRDAKSAYVIMLDVDHFKKINDRYGHVEGDRALVLVSQALKRACERLRFSLFLCRYGGDEFLMIAQTKAPDEVLSVIRDSLQDECLRRGGELPYRVEASMGYASWDGHIENFKKSVMDADKKMYEAKRSNG